MLRRSPHAAASSSGSRRTRVLIVEDDSAIAQMYALQLQHDGYEVAIASSGEGIPETVQRLQPDLVLLDIRLPGKDGFTVMAELEAEVPDSPPIVVLSNFGDPDMIERGRSLGVVDYVVKSRMTPEALVRRIPGWIARRGGPARGD